MTHPNEALIPRFYTALQNEEPEGMASCYLNPVSFEAPVFNLTGESAGFRVRPNWSRCYTSTARVIFFVFCYCLRPILVPAQNPVAQVGNIHQFDGENITKDSAMTHANEALITRFYTAFQNGDAGDMASCYHDQVRFQDPVFNLKGESAGNMWRMLVGRGGGNINITFSDVQANDSTGSAKWEAKYPFSKSGRKVHNVILAKFEFKDGLIVTHIDSFDLWKWTRMALGTTGTILGWTPFLQNKVRGQAAGQLKAFEAELAQAKATKTEKE